MKKSRLITILLLSVVLLLAFSSILVGCDPTKKGKETPSGEDVPPPWIFQDPGDEENPTPTYTPTSLMEKIVASIETPEQVLGIDFELEAVLPDGSKTTIAFKGNLYSEYRNELAFIVYRQLSSAQERERAFGIYMVNDKMYVDLGADKALLYLEDFNPNYIVSLAKAGVGKIPELLGDIDLGSLIKGFMPLVMPMIFESPTLKMTADGGQELSTVIKLKGLLHDLPEILDTFASGLNLPVDLVPFLNYLSGILPDGTYYLKSNFDADDKLTYLGVQIDDPEANKRTDLIVNMNISDTAVETGIPEIDEETELSKFSLTNIQFSIDLTLGTRGDKKFDVGKVVNALLGPTGILPEDFNLPENMLLVEGGTGLRLAFALDLDLNYHKDPVDRNKFAIELYLLDQFGNIADGAGSRPQAGIYYSQGSVYINLDNLLPNYMQNINIRVDADVSVLINALVDMITKAIDGALGTSFEDILNMGATVNGDGSVTVPDQEGLEELLAMANVEMLSLSAEEGGYTVNVGLKNFIEALADLLKFGGSIAVEGNSITITVGNLFLESVEALIGKKLGFAFPKMIPGVTLAFNLFEGGIESVTVDTSIDETLDIQLKVHEFLVGYEDAALDQRIADGIDTENTSYVNSLSSIFDAALGGIVLQTHFNMTFEKGKYNLAPLIASFGLKEIADIDIIWEFDEKFIMDLTIDLQIALDRHNPSESTFVLELKSDNGIPLANIEPGTVLVGIYGYRNAVYIDLSNFKLMNITLPKLMFDLQFSQIIFTLLDNLTADLLTKMNIEGGDLVFNFDLGSLLGLTAPATTAGAMALADAEGGEGSDTTTKQELSALLLIVNTDKIMPVVSLASIMAVIKLINGSLIDDDIAEALEMMEINVDLSMGRKQGFEFKFKGNLIPMVDADGISVYYYKDGEKLPSFDENGNRKIYVNTKDSKQYDYKKYNYGTEGFNLLFEMGTEKYPVMVGKIPDAVKFDFVEKAKEFSQYKSDLVQAIMDTVGRGELDLTLNLMTKDNQMDLQQMINTILASVGKRLDIPINLNLDEWQTDVKLLLQWDIDLNSSARTVVKLELQYRGKIIVGVYVYQNSLIVKLGGLGLFDAELVNSSIVANVFEMLNDYVNAIEGLDLNKIISDVLEKAGLPTLPGADGESGDIATDENVPTLGEDIQTMDLVKYVLRAVSLHNTSIALNFTSTLINTLLNELLGMNLGIDFSLDGMLDLFGNEFRLNLGVEDIEVEGSLQLNIGGKVEVDLAPEEIPDWDMSSGRLMAKTMLDNLDVGIMLDIANDTADARAANGNWPGYTRIRIWRAGTNDRLVGTADGALVPKGNIIIGIYRISPDRFDDSTTTEGWSKPVAYVVLDYMAQSNQMKLTLCKDVVNLIVDFGNYVKDIGIRLDLLGILEDVFDGLISTIDTAFGKTPSDPQDPTDPTTPPEPTEPESKPPTDAQLALNEVIENLDIVKLLSRGINVNLRSNGTFNVDVEFDPYQINKLIDDILSLVFSKTRDQESLLNLAALAPDMFSKDYLSNVAWTRMIPGSNNDTNSFWGSLRAQLTPMLREVVDKFAGLGGVVTDTLLGNVYDKQLGPIVRSILPFAVFNEFHVGLNVVDAAFANVYIEGYDHNQTIYDEEGNVAYIDSEGIKDENGEVIYAGSGARKEGYYTKVWLYNMFGSIGNPQYGIPGSEEGVVTWADIPSRIEYNPYAFASDGNVKGGGLEYLIEKHFSNKKAMFQYGSTGAVIKQNVSFALIKFVDENGNETAYSSGVLTDMNLSKKGTYTVRASATFGTYARSMDITVISLGLGGGLREVQGFSMHAYDVFPDFLTLVTEDGQTRKISTHSVTITDYAPETYEREHVVTANVRFNRDNIVKPVEITYLDSNVDQVIINGEAIDVKGGVPDLVIDLYNYELKADSSISDYVSDIFFFKYKDGKAAGITVEEAWKVTDKTRVEFYGRYGEIAGIDGAYITDVGGEVFTVKSTIGKDSVAQEVKLRVWIKTKEVNRLMIAGNENTLRVDPYAYYLYKVCGKEEYNPFPASAEAFYYQEYDGITDDNGNKSEEVFITWDQKDIDAIDYSWNTDNTYKPGNDLTVYLDNSKYAGNFTWAFETKVVVLRNEVQAVYFDRECTKSTLFIDPFNYALNKGEGAYPETGWVKFTNGSVLEMPLTWVGTENFVIEGYEARATQMKVIIGGGAKGIIKGDLEQTAYVNVKVNNLVPAGLDIAGSEYSIAHGGEAVFYIDPMQVLYYGQKAFPESVTMVYANGSRTTLTGVEWVFDEEITLEGRKGLKATVKVGEEEKYWYTVNVGIIDRSIDFASDLQGLTIDPYKYTLDEDGSRIYSGFTNSTFIYQTVASIDYSDTSDVRTSAPLLTTSGETSGEYKTYFRYVVEYSKKDKNNVFVDKTYASENFELIKKFFEDESENISGGATKIKSAVAREYFQVNVEWDLTEINYSLSDDYKVKMIAKALDKKFDKAFRVTATVTAKEVEYVGGQDYYISLSYGGRGLTEQEILTKSLSRNLYVLFTDGTGGTYNCTIDLSSIDFENYHISTLDAPVTRQETVIGDDGTEKTVDVTYYYADNAGNLVLEKDFAGLGATVQVTVCSGDIAQTVNIKALVILDRAQMS